MEDRIDYFERMLADNPDNPTGLLALANEYEKAGRDEDEAAVLERYLAVHVDLGGNLLPVGARRPHPRRAPGLEELPRPPVDGIEILPVVLVEFQHIAEVRPEKLVLRLSLQSDHTLT